MMPGWLQAFARYRPATPMVKGERSALAGGSHGLAAVLVWSAALVAVCALSP
jgi:hypothetical protein